jgi:hypothetical protein
MLLRLGAYDVTLDPDARSPETSGMRKPLLSRTAGSRVTRHSFVQLSPTSAHRALLYGRDGISLKRLLRVHPTTFGQVVLIQFAAAVDSLWVVPGFGQPIGAVMFRIGMVMIRAGSQLANS